MGVSHHVLVGSSLLTQILVSQALESAIFLNLGRKGGWGRLNPSYCTFTLTIDVVCAVGMEQGKEMATQQMETFAYQLQPSPELATVGW